MKIPGIFPPSRSFARTAAEERLVQSGVTPSRAKSDGGIHAGIFIGAEGAIDLF